MKKARFPPAVTLSAVLRMAAVVMLLVPAGTIVAQTGGTQGLIDVYQSGTHGMLLIASAQPVTYALRPDSEPGHDVLSLRGQGVGMLVRGALRRPALLSSRLVESFAIVDADHVDVLLRAPAAGLEARSVSGAGGMTHCVLVGTAHEAFPSVCPDATQPVKTTQGIYEIVVNGEDQGAAVVLAKSDGAYLFDPEDVKRWRLGNPVMDRLGYENYEGKKYLSVANRQGVTVTENAKAAAIHIAVAPADFEATMLHVRRAATGEPMPSSYGAYLNYNLSGESVRGKVSGGALLDAHAFGPQGSVSSSFLARSHSTGPGTVRLDSFYEKDNPSTISHFRVGDSLTGASDWALPERFAGVQWATDFSTRPDLVTFPLESLAGTASVPSTVELFLNQSLLLRQNVPAGPFAIQQVPVVTGNGELRMVVLNALGEQQTIEQPFYADASLLRPGMRSYSYEMGFERLNYGLVSNDYGHPLASGTERVGVTDTLTAAVHGEWRPGIQTLGASAAVLVSTLGVLSSSIAGSHGPDGSGGLLGLGFDHHGARLDFGLRAQATSVHFTQLGLARDTLSPSSLLSAYVALAVARGGTLAFNVTRQHQRDAASLGVAGMSYSQSLGPYGFLQLSVLHTTGATGGMMVGLNYTCPIGTRSSAALDIQRQGGSTQEMLQLQQNAPYGNGMGYRVLAGLGPDHRGEVDATKNTDSTSYYLAVTHGAGGSAYQASATGSIALLGGEMHFTRQIADSFGVVRVPGFAGVRVYEDNQLVGKTNANGDAFVPNLRSYQANNIQIEQADLPLDVEVSSASLTAIPYQHSGLVLTFPVKQVDNASYALVQADGAFVPAGSKAVYEGKEYPVGFGGLVYLPRMKPSERLVVSWPTGHCVVSAPSSTQAVSQPRLECR